MNSTYIPNSIEMFNRICNLAKAKHKSGLIELINSGIFIDHPHNLRSPVSVLAESGEKEAVKFLIDNFNASLNEAVYGFALRGDVQMVEKLIDQGASRDWAIKGYAEKNNHIEVNLQLKKGANLNVAIQGYAKSGNEMKVNEYSSLSKNKCISSMYMQIGYASGNHVKIINALILSGVSIVRDVPLYYVLCGNLDEAKRLSQLFGGYEYELLGYAKLGNTSEINNLITRGADRSYATWGYAAMDNIAAVESELIMNPSATNYAAFGYAITYNISQLNQIISRYNSDLCSLAFGYISGKYLSNHKSTVRLLTFTEDEAFSKVLATAAVGENSSLNSAEMMEQANRLKYLMKTYQFNYQQAQAWMLLELHVLLLQVRLQTIPKDIILYIASFIADLSIEDTYDFDNKLRFIMNKKFLRHDLATCVELGNQNTVKHSRFSLIPQSFFSTHANRAKALLESSKDINDPKSMTAILDKEEKDAFFSVVVDKRYQNFRS